MPRIGLAACFAAAALAQTAAPPPAFEVASIKAAPKWKGEGYADGYQAGMRAALFTRGMDIRGKRVAITDHSVVDLMRLAYGVKNYQVIGPAWMAAEKFDVAATMANDTDKPRAPEMLQTLLADRFQVTFHREKREIPVYALVAVKGGTKLQETQPVQPASVPAEQIARGAMHMDQPETIRARHLRGHGMTLAKLADDMIPFADRPIVDMTGLSGKYDIDLAFWPEVGEPGGETAPPLGTALQQQLGLRLEARKLMFDVLVIDRVERPTEN